MTCPTHILYQTQIHKGSLTKTGAIRSITQNVQL